MTEADTQLTGAGNGAANSAGNGPAASPDLLSIRAVDQTPQQPSRATFFRLLRLHADWRAPAFIGAVAALIVAVAAIGALWYWAIPPLFTWGFFPPKDVSLASRVVRGGLTVVGLFFVIFLPVWLPSYPFRAARKILHLQVEEDEQKLRDRLAQAQSDQRSAETELEDEDKSGLIPLIRYSRAQLDAYYAIGLAQTQRSFRYSVIAMWIGFGIFVIGLAPYAAPPQWIPKRPDANVAVLPLLAGAIIEVISALFIWVYRSSVAQLTYFYNRQMHTHNVLMCYRIADSMSEKDASKRLIIEKVMDATWAPDRPRAPSAGGIQKLLETRIA